MRQVPSFEQFQFQPFINEALAEKEFEEPTEVRERLIPIIKKGRGVIGQSQTGNGKARTFLLPLIDKAKPTIGEVRIMITASSRGLASQIYQEVQQLAHFSQPEIRVSNFVGGIDEQHRLNKLKRQQPHVVIDTPGRILDMMNEQILRMHTASVFVVDKADMILDMGFLVEVDQIADRLPKKLQMFVFSATIPEELRPFLRKYLENPVTEHIKPKAVISEAIGNWLISTKGKNNNKIIYQLLTIGHPYLAIVFVNTKQRIDEITDYLKDQGLKAAGIHGDATPRERKRVMHQAQNLDYQYVVATDLAARRIGIEGVSHVINAEVPRESDFFIHQAGRTGRNGLNGAAMTLCSPAGDEAITQIEQLGASFKPKEIKNGEIVETYGRDRRAKRGRSREELNPMLIGLVKKKKKKIRPEYKKKINWTTEDSNKKKRRIERRQKDRSARKVGKNSSN